MTWTRSTRRGLSVGNLLVAVGLASAVWLPVRAETCLSPFVKRLERPEKYLYLFCVDADAKDNDFLAVIDVSPDSATFGTIINTLDLGTKGNETHHFGYTDDRRRIWAGGLFSSRIWLIDVATDPAKPRIEKVLENVSGIGDRRLTGRNGGVHQRRQVHPPHRPPERRTLCI
jgi:selenium-binding protein 1